MCPMCIETPYISTHMDPMCIETPYINTYMNHMCIDTTCISLVASVNLLIQFQVDFKFFNKV